MLYVIYEYCLEKKITKIIYKDDDGNLKYL